MPFLIIMMLVFVLLGMLWLIGAGLLLATALSGVPNVLDTILNYKGKNCTCHFPFKHN